MNLTPPGGLRSALARAVMEVAPEKARQRREAAAKSARVERWAEDSGNAALALVRCIRQSESFAAAWLVEGVGRVEHLGGASEA